MNSRSLFNIQDNTMKRVPDMRIILQMLFCALLPDILFGQPVIHPWHVVDQGGGKSSASGVLLQASVGQAAVQAMSAAGSNLESGYIPGLRDFSGANSTLACMAAGGWNLISVPVIVSDFHKATIYPTSVSNAFGYKGGYFVNDSLANGVGYWLKFPGAGSIALTGTTIQQESVAVTTGWNMIGPPSYPVPLSAITPVGTTVTSHYFAYSSSGGYLYADTLDPGAGYWVKVSGPGKLLMVTGSVILAPRSALSASRKNSPPATLEGVNDMNGIGLLKVRDGAGNERMLFFSSSRMDVDPANYEVPPLPPEGTMDVRYGTNRLLEIADSTTVREVAIRVSSAKYPLTLSWTESPACQTDVGSAVTSLVIDGKETAMRGASEVRVASAPTHLGIRFQPSVSVPMPKTFALYQNYPNPFNPSTTIRYDLPKDSRVTLRIYDALGGEVKTVKDEVEGAGYRSAVWGSVNGEGRSVASGVYFYRIEAMPIDGKGTPFVQVKKMVVLR